MIENEIITANGELSKDLQEKLQSDLVFTEGVSSKKPLSLLERAVCELRADRKSNKYIANYLGASLSEVKSILSRPHVKEFLQDLINAQYEISKEYRLELLSKIAEDKIKEVEREHNGDFAKATKKDLVDILMLQDTILKEREKKELGTTEDTYINLIQQVMN